MFRIRLNMWAGRYAIGLLVGMILVLPGGRLGVASVLDWNGLSYTPGSLTATYTNVDGSGVDIRISIADPDSILRSFSGTASPYIGNSPLTGGQPAGQQDNLFLYVQPSPNTEVITITVDFFLTGTTTAAQVEYVSFLIFDVDKAGGTSWIDELRNFEAENSVTGTGPFGPTAITPTNASNTQVTGSGLSYVVTGINEVSNNSDQANVTVRYIDQPLTGYQFDYGHSPASANSPSGIGLSRIHFQLIPETETWFAAAGLLALATLTGWRRLCRRRAQTPS